MTNSRLYLKLAPRTQRGVLYGFLISYRPCAVLSVIELGNDEGFSALIRTRPSVSLVDGKLLIMKQKRYVISPRPFRSIRVVLLSWLMVLISNINLHTKCDLMKGRRTPSRQSLPGLFVPVCLYFQEGFQRQAGCWGGEMNCGGWISFHRRWCGGGVVLYVPCAIVYFIPASGERERGRQGKEVVTLHGTEHP